MTVNHSNPTRPRVDRNSRKEFWARAPYNFVPLPEQMVTVAPPLDHSAFHPGAFTGWIECSLETLSPLYVRGMLPEKDFREWGGKESGELTPQQKDEKARFFAPDPTHLVEGKPCPVIPGSSLRGAIRSLVEIIGCGRVRWVGKSPTFTFRAVAAQRDDPLASPYREVIGAFSRNVRAGYLKKVGGGAWQIIPAKAPKDLGLPEQGAYLKVKEHQVGSKDLPGFIRLSSPNYKPQVHQVSFSAQTQTTRDRKAYAAITQIGPLSAGHPYRGVLVCSGNMIEGAPAGTRTNRKNHALVLEPDEKARPLSIHPQVIRDYENGVSVYERDEVAAAWGGDPGCLADGKPVFYTAVGSQVTCFGHCPNFRIPARQKIGSVERAVTPFDMIPEALLEGSEPDLADALFGWVEDREDGVGPKKQCAGRVFFGDAQYTGSRAGVWYRPQPIIPHTLSGPKPSTFQHYLVQDRRQNHDPDRKETLAHYATPRGETGIRGHKLYWTRGENPPIEASAKELEHESQLTRITPLKPGVSFTFKVRFENLRVEELGALWWALALPAGEGQTLCHRLGMGKPLGMGAVKLTPTLHLTDRTARYRALFDGDRWQSAEKTTDPGEAVRAFERLVLAKLAPEKTRLEDLERIQELLAMLAWREGSREWLDATRYMEIEREPGRVNEYKERPVLPTPRGVLALLAGQPLPREEVPAPSKQAAPPAEPVRQKPQPPKIEPGARVRAVVLYVEDNGDVYLEKLEGDPGGKLVGRIKKASLGGKTFDEGDSVLYQVERLLAEGGETIVEGRVEAAPGSLPAGYASGVVKSYGLGAASNYGFIAPDDGGPDIFVHASKLTGELSTLVQGQRVTFKKVKGMKGKWEAHDVRLL